MNRKYITTRFYSTVKAGLSTAALTVAFAAPLHAHSEHKENMAAINAEQPMDHSAHQGHSMPVMAQDTHDMHTEMKHTGHEGHNMPAEEDPHAHHKAMMSNATQDKIQRSSHPYQTPALTMVNQNNKPVDIQKLLNSDKPVMVNFIFTTCPTICPVLSSTFSIVNRELAEERDLSMISISIDPEEDTPEALLRYAKKFEARENWTFITGTVEDSITLQKAFDIYRGSKMNHEAVTYFRASSDKLWTRLDGFPSSDLLITEYHHMQMGH